MERRQTNNQTKKKEQEKRAMQNLIFTTLNLFTCGFWMIRTTKKKKRR
jgi:hypothetical protein